MTARHNLTSIKIHHCLIDTFLLIYKNLSYYFAIATFVSLCEIAAFLITRGNADALLASAVLMSWVIAGVIPFTAAACQGRKLAWRLFILPLKNFVRYFGYQVVQPLAAILGIICAWIILALFVKAVESMLGRSLPGTELLLYLTTIGAGLYVLALCLFGPVLIVDRHCYIGEAAKTSMEVAVTAIWRASALAMLASGATLSILWPMSANVGGLSLVLILAVADGPIRVWQTCLLTVTYGKVFGFSESNDLEATKVG